MNNEMKRLLSKFLFSSVLICCVGTLLSGSITASQKSAKLTFDKAYEVMNIKNSGEKLELNVGENNYSLSIDFRDKIKEYEDYILLTPLSGVYYFWDSLSDIKKQES